MLLITTIDDRPIDLMPFFMAHHARMGIDRFVVGVYRGRDNPNWGQIEKCAPMGVSVQVEMSTSVNYDHLCGKIEAEWANRVRGSVVDHETWYATADLDEFVWFGGKTFQQMQEEAEDRNCHTVATPDGDAFADRVGLVGFPTIPKYGASTLDDTFPLECKLTRAVGAGTSKTVMARGDVEILSGHHYTEGHPVLRDAAKVHHFKWNAHVVDLLPRRYNALVRSGRKHAEESNGFMNLFMRDANWRYSHGIELRPAQKIGI